MFSLQQNWRRGKNRFCLEMREVGSRRRAGRNSGIDGPINVCTYELMYKQLKNKIHANLKKKTNKK
jgi:hypothetical protein